MRLTARSLLSRFIKELFQIRQYLEIYISYTIPLKVAQYFSQRLF